MNKLLPLAAILLSGLTTSAQHEKCTATTTHNAALQANPAMAVRQQAIEQYTHDWITQHPNGVSSRTVMNIPVVIHIVHGGEAVGTGTNISDAQALSQIEVLNRDFNNLNTDSMPASHAFYPLVGNAQINFCLATVDPQGAPTSGIERIDGQARFSIATWANGAAIDGTLKPATTWDATRYLNLWVLTFTAGGEDSSTLGYATFPDAHGSATDGVVILTTAFGNTGNVTATNGGGRTGTHEVGHYLNLFHIWGDQNCGNDSVSDTPPQVDKNGGCPSFPHNANNTCGSDANGEMYMDYMDYVDDACMIMFSKGQAARMQAALSGPRASLLSSTVCSGVNGINPVSYAPQISVYPNPASATINVSVNMMPDEASVEIYDAIGQKMLSQNFAQATQMMNLNVSNFAPGAYSVAVTSAHQKYFTKVVITK
jgi:hypothetical protein